MGTKNETIIGHSRKASATADGVRHMVMDRPYPPTRFARINSDVQLNADVDCEFSGNENVRDRIFAMSENLIAFVSLGPLMAGHTLICPRFPSNCIGEVISDAHIQAEFSRFLADVSTLLAKVFGGETLLFEHGGSSGVRPVGCSVLHAHLHVIPGVTKDAIKRLVVSNSGFIHNREFDWNPVKGVLSTKFPAATWQDYLFLSANQSSWLAKVTGEQVVPPQYLRQAVGEAVGNEQWDWRESSNIPLVTESLHHIKKMLQSLEVELFAAEGPIFMSPFTRVDFD